MAKFELTREQKDAVESRGGSLLVSAAAGSGKTRVLVERLISRMVEEGVNINRFLVITYTKAAAGELRGRIAEELQARIQAHPTDSFLRRQAAFLYQAQISTIHSYCARLLREHVHALDLDPDFRQMEESEAQLLQQQVLDALLEQRYQAPEEYEGFSALCEMMMSTYSDKRLTEVVLDIHQRIQGHPKPLQWLEEQAEQFEPAQLANISETSWAELLMHRARSLVRYARDLTQRSLVCSDADEKLQEKYSPALRDGMAQLDAILALEHPTWDELRDAVKTVSFPAFKRITKDKLQNPEAKQTVTALRDLAKKQLKQTQELLRDDSESAREGMLLIAPAMQALFALIRDFSLALTEQKRQQNCVDFSDLEHLAAQLLTKKDGSLTEIALQEQKRFVEVMVDEYQDTNAVQNTIFDAISDEGDKLFMVGDVKQSIYRFRLAEPQIFLNKSKVFPLYEGEGQKGARKVLLSENFRSRGEVLDAANELFACIMSPECGGLRYDEEAWLNEPKPHEPRLNCQTELALIETSHKEHEASLTDNEKVSAYLQEARYVAARIEQLVECGFLDAQGTCVERVRYEDIAILRHSLANNLAEITQALEERGIPWTADGGETLFGTPEIEIVLSLLKIIDNPRQDIPLISVLRSPLFRFTDDRLAELRSLYRQGDFYDVLMRAAEAEQEDCSAFLARLARLREQARQMDLYSFFWLLYDELNIMGIFGALQSGQARQNHLFTLLEAAKSFEAGAGRGLFAFLRYCENLREQGKSLGQEQQSGGKAVQIKTVHKSKGLQYPVVFLMGTGGRINLSDERELMLFDAKSGVGPKGYDPKRRLRYPTLARDAVKQVIHREIKSEAMRLLYVAMTRASSKMIISCTMNKLEDSVANLALQATLPMNPRAIEQMDSTGKWITTAALMRPEAQHLRDMTELSVPVNHALTGAAWDIRLIDGLDYYEAPQLEPTVQYESSDAYEDVLSAQELMARYTWEYPHSGSDIPSKITATGLKGRFLDAEIQEEAASMEPKHFVFDRPAFVSESHALTPAEKGTALHLAMQFLDFKRLNSLEEIQRAVDELAQRQLLTQQQAESVDCARIAGFIQSEVGQELLHAKQLSREFKFSVLMPAANYYPQVQNPDEQVLLQGVIDVYYEREDGSIVVLDFKTDYVTLQTLAQRGESYRPQLEAYAQALARITGRQVCEKIIWFFSLDTAYHI